MLAYILCDLSPLADVKEAVEGISLYKPAVKEVYALYGSFDLIMKVNMETTADITTFNMATLPEYEVITTSTLIVNENITSFESDEPKSAYIFCRLPIRKNANEVLSALKENENIIEASYIFGIYDVIIGISEAARHDTFNMVTSHLRMKELGILRSDTMHTVKF